MAIKIATYIRKNKEVFFLSIFSTLLLFFISPDSYTHDMFCRIDSAIFFSSGKAWMNGMVPYVDFSDSKGPLLWLIFGIGYILSPTTYIGVFWISCIFYAIVCVFTFKTAHIFLKNRTLSLVCILLLLTSYFNHWIHFEFRAEDCCQPFIAIALYRLIKTIYVDGIQKSSWHITNIITGVCFMAFLLIKFTIAAMMGIAYLYYVYFIIKQKNNIVNIVIAMLEFICGNAIIAFPFIIHFVTHNNFDAFIYEYFLNTLQTVQDSNSFTNYIHEWLGILSSSWAERLILFCISCIGCIFFSKHVEHDKYFPLIMFLGFFSISIHHAFGNYYISSCLIFPIWFFAHLVYRMKETILSNPRIIVTYSAISILVFLVVFNHTTKEGYLIRNAFFYNNTERTSYYHVAYLMAQIHKPKVIYFESQDCGYGTPADALPGSIYWTSQLGATKKMKEVQKHDIQLKKADFIITDNKSTQYKQNTEFLKLCGYSKKYTYIVDGISYDLFSKHIINQPPESFNISNLDVLFKRKVITPQFNQKLFIAHGAGEIDSYRYTNSYEALMQSLKEGYQFIEIDLGMTSDSIMVCVHDWQEFNTFAFNYKDGGKKKRNNPIPTFREFKETRIYGKYTPMSVEDVLKVREKYPFTLVLDKISDVKLLNKYFKNATRPIMVEAFSTGDYNNLLAEGYTPMMSLGGVTFRKHKGYIKNGIPYNWITADTTSNLTYLYILKKLFDFKIAMYTSNSPLFFKKHLGKEIDLLYTDNGLQTYQKHLKMPKKE